MIDTGLHLASDPHGNALEPGNVVYFVQASMC